MINPMITGFNMAPTHLRAEPVVFAIAGSWSVNLLKRKITMQVKITYIEISKYFLLILFLKKFIYIPFLSKFRF